MLVLSTVLSNLSIPDFFLKKRRKIRTGKKVYKCIMANTSAIGGAGIAQWLERRTRDRKVAGSNPCWSGGRIFFSRVDFLC